MSNIISIRNIWKAVLASAVALIIGIWIIATFQTGLVANFSNKIAVVFQGTEALAIALSVFCLYQLIQDQKHRALQSAIFGGGCVALGIALRYFVSHQYVLRMAVIDLGGVAFGMVAATLQPDVNMFLRVRLYEGLNAYPAKRKKLEGLLDVLSLFATFAYVSYCFLGSTTFPLIYPNTLRYFVIALVIFGGMRFLYYFLRELWSVEDETSRLKLVGKTALIFCVAVPFVLSGVVSERDQLIVLPLLMLCLWRMQPERVLRDYALVVGTLLAATVMCCLAGCIRNIGTLEGKSSYGIINTTDFAAYFIFLLLCIWCMQRVRAWYTTLFLVVLCIATATATYYLAGSRTTVICCVMIVAACIWEWLTSRLGEKSKLVCFCTKAVDALCIGAFPLTVVVLCCFTYAYGKGEPWVLQLDEVLSHRFLPIWEVLNKQGVHMLGKVFKMHGRGNSVLGPGGTYDFLDSSYAYLLIRNGILVFAAVTCLWVWMSIRAVRGNRRRLVLALAIVAFYGFSEYQMINVNYNIFLVMPFCALSASQKCEDVGQDVVRRWFISLGVGALLIAAVYLLAPRMLSWLRTAFFLLKWTYSYRTVWALLFAVAVVACLMIIWKTVPLATQKNARAPKLTLAVPLFALTISLLWMNSTIQLGTESHDSELDAEREAIKLIQSSSTQPVYAAEKSELYQRKFGGFADYSLTAEDLTRTRKGTILVDKGHDSIWLPATGASYIQFSDTSGLYSYDQDMIEALKATGWKATQYNSSEHIGNLDDLAKLNGLLQDEHGGLKLNGPDNSLIENRALDQLAGSYEVWLVFHADSDSLKKRGKGEVCTFRAMTNRNEDLVCEKTITANEFNKEGELEITIPYQSKNNSPRLQYTITAADGVTVYVDKISWKRVA